MGKKTTRVRRNFTPEFKKDAVRLLRGGRTVTDVAERLGIARSLLQRWREQIDASGA
jgi:transposase-like protein